MGLDVYLKRCDDLAGAKAREAQASEYEEGLWEAVGGYSAATEEQKEEIRAKSKAKQEELGLGEWGEADEIEAIEIPSAKYPDNMFKIGYLRSSYNEGGINSVLARIGVPDLYDIFEPNDEYNFTPDWEKAAVVCQASIDGLTAFMNSDMAKYDVTRITDLGSHGGVKDAGEALKVFQEQLSKHKPGGFNSYGCREGEFFLDGITVVGVIPNRGFGGGSFLITRNDNEESNLQWYLEALEVTQEMIDYVLAKPNPNTYYLAWSG